MRVSEAALALITRVNPQGVTEYLTQWNEKWQAYSLIGGHRHPGESFRACCIREIEEELGLTNDLGFRTDAEPIGPLCEYTAFSQSSGVETHYRIELFQAHILTTEGMAEVDANPHNRWLSGNLLGRGVAAGSLRIADQVGRVLDFYGIWIANVS